MFALYIAGYPVGRVVFEFMRSDEANRILGLRVNVWTSVLVFLLGLACSGGSASGRTPGSGETRRVSDTG